MDYLQPGGWGRLRKAIAAAVLVIGLSSPALAGNRVALVIGNSAYQSASPLKNPRNDAAALAAALERMDFKVITGFDLDDRAFKTIIGRFAAEAQNAEAALFFYAGHGLQVEGRNYLLPINARLGNQYTLDFEAIRLEFILGPMERGQRTSIVLLDACRDNPMAQDLARSMGTRSASLGRGLARVDTGVGTYIGFATQPGNVALDGEGDHSPFTAALLKNVETPGLDIETLMRKVRADVIGATNGRQVPWGNSSLVGGFTFAAGPAPEPVQPPGPDHDVELSFWNTVKDAKNPALLRAYLEKYPRGQFAGLAKLLIDAPDKEPAAAEPKAAANGQQVAAIESPGDPSALKAQQEARELAFWNSIKDSKDAKPFKAYLRKYPKGAFADVARSRAAEPGQGSDPCERLVGTWSWFIGGDVVFSRGGSLKNGFQTGQWSCKNGSVAIHWAMGFRDNLQLSADGTSLRGTNQFGSVVTGHRKGS